jgi:vacuolar-type H+-ATPase subunit I/STV1
MEMQAQIVTPEVEKSTETALTVIDVANSLVISTVDDYKVAQGLMKTVKERIQELTDERMGQTRLLDKSKAKIIAFFATPLEKLEKAKAYLNKIMVDFTEVQEARRREEERRLQEEARKRAEEEALRQALEAEQAGEKEEAEAILQEPVYVPPVKVASNIPKSKESHIRESWSAQVVDLMGLVKGIASGKVAIQAIEANMPFLNTQARHYREMMPNAFPGIVAVSKKTQI